MSACPNTYAYVIHGINEAFEKAMKALDGGNTNLANFYLEKLVKKLQSLSGTRLLSKETASEMAHEFAETIREKNLQFSETTVDALIIVESLGSS